VKDDNHVPTIAAPLGDICTSRLDLRRFALSDLDELAQVFSQPEVWWFPYGRGLTRSETEVFLHAQLREWEEYGFGCWVTRERSVGTIVGYVGLSVPTFLPEILPAVEVGWRFSPTVWGNGYATEGAVAALNEAFTTLQLERVCSVPQSDNPSSVRVATRLGMRLIREIVIPANERRGAVRGAFFEMERSEWIENEAKPNRSSLRE
jgi:RimJ/RimL family protein N-acetyltransferase